MENVINGTKDTLNDLIANGKTTIVDFWATWCGPCKALSPMLDVIAQENPEIQVVKINVDDNSDLSVEYSIRSIPTVCIFKEGVQTDKFVGIKTKSEIIEKLK